MIDKNQIIYETIKSLFEMNDFKIRAGRGDWYVLYQNGRVILEGNRPTMINYLKKFTNYDNNQLNKIFDDSLTDSIIINVNKDKLKSLLSTFIGTDKLNIINTLIK